jgi:hypothetical protein
LAAELVERFIWERVDELEKATDAIRRQAKAFDDRCEIDAGAEGSATAPPAVDDDKPSWNPDLCELSFRGKVVRRLRRTADRAILILNTFREDGWPQRIDNPLSPPDDDLARPVRTLNENLIEMQFWRDGSGDGIIWRAI